MTRNIILYISTFLLGFAGAGLIAKYGGNLKLLDIPTARSSHLTETPKGGGVGILSAFLAASLILRLPEYFWMPTVVLSLVSFVGDRFELSPVIRLVFQFTASIIFLFGLWKTHPNSSVGYFLIIQLALYIVGTTNFYNFMDGINGLAAITGIVGFGLMASYGVNSAILPALNPLSISMAFCCAGFLPFNMPEAKVFMGDVGSILLGFVFAAMVVWYATSLSDFLCLASFLFPFYADEITTAVIRLKNRENLGRPHRKHLYQILANEYNISHWKISLGYGIAQLVIGVFILFFNTLGVFPILFILIVSFCIFSALSLVLRKKLINEI